MNERAQLEELLGCYEGLLVALDGSGPATDSVERAWRRCKQATEALTPLDEMLARVPGAERADCTDLLQRITRLHAIATDAVGEHIKDARSLLRATREERRSLDFYVSDGDSGVSCDVSG